MRAGRRVFSVVLTPLKSRNTRLRRQQPRYHHAAGKRVLQGLLHHDNSAKLSCSGSRRVRHRIGGVFQSYGESGQLLSGYQREPNRAEELSRSGWRGNATPHHSGNRGKSATPKLITQATAPSALELTRYFRSSWGLGIPRTLAVDPGLGRAWSHNFSTSLSLEEVPAKVARVLFGDGRVPTFIRNSGSSPWTATSGPDALVSCKTARGTAC